jgi:hypothetical protein
VDLRAAYPDRVRCACFWPSVTPYLLSFSPLLAILHDTKQFHSHEETGMNKKRRNAQKKHRKATERTKAKRRAQLANKKTA